MMGSNPKIDIVNINAYIKYGEFLSICYANIKFGEILSICLQDIEQKRNTGIIQGPELCKKCAGLMCNNLNLDLGNMNSYIKLGEILSICSQDNERKRYSSVNQGS